MKNTLQTSLRTALVALCALTLYAPQAKADIQAIRSADNEIWGSVGTSLFNYKEPAAKPDLPDSEHGWLPSLAAGVSMLNVGETNGIIPSNLYVAIDTNVSFGDAHYNGAYLGAPTTPLQGTTNETIVNVDGKLGRGFALGYDAMLIPYGEVDFHDWRRDLGAGQVETYLNLNALGGAMLQIAPTNRLVLSGYAAAGTTLDARLKDSNGNTFDLGNSGVYKVGGKIGFALAPRTELFTTLDYDHFHYVQSPPVGGFYEPTSRTEDTTMRVGLGYQFR